MWNKLRIRGRRGITVLLTALATVGVVAAESGYRQVVDGVAIYLGVVPAELVRGHPRGHPESEMHGGAPAGENHIMVALFDDKTGKRLTGVEISATITGPRRFKTGKRLEPMVIEGASTHGNYFYMPGTGPYRIFLEIRRPGVAKPLKATFEWART